MTKLRWSPQAARELEAIRDYIAGDSPRYAALVVERIVVAVERLTQFPESGRIVPERNDPALREVIVAPATTWSSVERRRLAEDFRSYVLEVERRAYGGRYLWYQDREPVLMIGAEDSHVAIAAYG